jgi:hypothetical protein
MRSFTAAAPFNSALNVGCFAAAASNWKGGDPVKQSLKCTILATVITVGAAGLPRLMAQQALAPVFIAGDQPVTAEQVRKKMLSDGWSDIHLVVDGQYFRVVASKDGETERITIDSETGRLGADDDDDDDDDDH